MSNSIDEKIVSIKFNNAQFEAGIKTTMSSLDGLKKTLNFEAGVKALGDLDAAGRKVTPPKFDGTAFNNGVQTTINATDNLKKNLKFDGAIKGLNDLDAAGKKVNVKLDPTPFQMGAKGVVDAANTIKQNLNFESAQRGIGNLKSSIQNFSFSSVIEGSKSAAKSLADLDLGAKAVSFLPIEQGAERAKQSISMMSVAGIAAIASLAVKAASAGAEMAKSLFIDPAKSGLAEYELNLGSIQTIMANTQSKGSTLTDVNAALDELNAYSDKTIYNFAEMAKNIGTFTSAGVGLKDSTMAIKGISNLAALSGSNSEQASTAMYQLSQAMSTGAVKLQDWNSVVNAGMGGEVFQNALKETARNQGKNVDALIKQNGSFRESLQEGWLTDKVMLETLSKMTGDLSDEQLRQMGYGDAQIKSIQEMAKTAGDAATKIKTFSQLTGTLSEITGSGWAQTWKLILGDFEQAKEMWTSVYNVLGAMVQGSADARNKLLGDWNALGGRTEMIWAVSKAFQILMSVLTPVKEAFREVFPPMTGKQLYEITQAIRIFLDAIAPGPDQINLIKQSFKLLFTIIKMGVDIIHGALSVVFAFFKAFATGGDSISGSLKPLTDGLTALTDRIKNSTFIADFFTRLSNVAMGMGTSLRHGIEFVIALATAFTHLLKPVQAFIALNLNHMLDHFWYVIDTIQMLFQYILPGIFDTATAVVKAFLVDGLSGAIDAFYSSMDTLGNVGDMVLTRIHERMASIGRLFDTLGRAWDQMVQQFARFWEKILPIREAVAKLFQDLGQQLKAAFTDVNFNDTLDMVNTGLLAGLFLIFKGFFKKLLGLGDGAKDGLLKSLSTSVDSINGVLESLSGTLEAMQQNLKADTLMKIALAIGVMTISVIALSMLDSGKLTQALIGIGVMVAILSQAMNALDKISAGSGFLKLPFIAGSMILLAIALGLLVVPVVVLSKLSWVELLKGLGGLSVMLYALSKTVESMAKNPADLIATGVGLMAIAFAVRILADAVSIMGALDLGTLIKGLGGVAVVLFALSKTVESMSKNPADLIATGLGIVAIALGIKILASAVGDFGALDIGSIIQGIVSLAIVLKLLENFTKGVGDTKNIIQTAFAMLILGASLKVIASAMRDFASMSWEETAKGLLIMRIALVTISDALARVPPNMFTSAAGFVVVAFSLKILASALADFASMSWEEIGKGMLVLAGSLILLSGALIAMSGTLSGAAAMGIAAVSMVLMAQALTMFGNLTWDQLLIGLASLAGIFVVFGLAGLVLGPVVPVIMALGIAMAFFGAGLIGVGIGTLAFVTGLLALAAAGAVVGPVIAAVVMSILALIPMAMEEMAKGIVAFAGVIGNAMPVFLNAFVALLTTLLQAINLIFPQIMDTLWIVIVGLVALIVRAVPLFVDAGMKIIIGILTGIGNNIGQLVDAASRVITQFIDGIARNLGQIIQSGANLVISFVEGLAAAVRNNSQRMTNAGLDLASAIIEGMVNGLGSMVGRVLGAVSDVANNVLNTAKNILGIHSPSREFYAIGKFTTMGWANGVDKYGDTVVDAHAGVANSALDTVKKTMSNIDGLMSSEVNMNPTIRPVLDLSAIKKDGAQIDGMLGVPSLSLSASYDKASALASADRVRRETSSGTSTEAVTSSAKGDQYNFTQINNSPKAISSADTYRGTKNQISALRRKGVGTPANA
jgi:tape measure domain-containing protein